jgi:hypothetical protein
MQPPWTRCRRVSARSIGATLCTADAEDFESIRQVRDFSLEIVRPD